MIYELRTYTAVPGREDALAERFRTSTLGIFKRLGIEVTEFWRDAKDRRVLIYVAVWTSEEQMKASWEAFRQDREWQTAKKETENDGPLVESIESRICEPFG